MEEKGNRERSPSEVRVKKRGVFSGIIYHAKTGNTITGRAKRNQRFLEGTKGMAGLIGGSLREKTGSHLRGEIKRKFGPKIACQKKTRRKAICLTCKLTREAAGKPENELSHGSASGPEREIGVGNFRGVEESGGQKENRKDREIEREITRRQKGIKSDAPLRVLGGYCWGGKGSRNEEKKTRKKRSLVLQPEKGLWNWRS